MFNTRKIFLLIVTLFLMFFTYTNTYADIIPEWNFHYVDRCVKITNLGDYSEIYIKYWMWDEKKWKKEEIKYNQCISKGYKFNDYKIYYKIPGEGMFTGTINFNEELYGGYVPDSDKRKKEVVEYIVYKKLNKVYLKKVKEIITYIDGTVKEKEITPFIEMNLDDWLKYQYYLMKKLWKTKYTNLNERILKIISRWNENIENCNNEDYLCFDKNVTILNKYKNKFNKIKEKIITIQQKKQYKKTSFMYNLLWYVYYLLDTEEKILESVMSDNKLKAWIQD